MTQIQNAVLEYIKDQKRYVSPTEIGAAVGGGNRHSAWASPICKRLVELGVAKRRKDGWYSA